MIDLYLFGRDVQTQAGEPRIASRDGIMTIMMSLLRIAKISHNACQITTSITRQRRATPCLDQSIKVAILQDQRPTMTRADITGSQRGTSTQRGGDWKEIKRMEKMLVRTRNAIGRRENPPPATGVGKMMNLTGELVDRTTFIEHEFIRTQNPFVLEQSHFQIVI